MDARINKPGKADNRMLRMGLLLTGMLLVLIVIGVFLYARVNALLNRYMEVQGEKQAETLSELTQRQFEVELTSLFTVASELPRIEGMRADALRAIQEADYDGRIGVQYIDNTPFYGEAYSPEDFPCIERARHGERAISYCEGKGLMFAVPAMRDDNITSIVYRLYPEDILYARFGVDSYSGAGYTRIVDADGHVVVPCQSPDDSETLLFGQPEIDAKLADLEHALYIEDSDASFTQSAIGDVMLYAANIQDSAFHLIGYVPKSVVMQGVDGINNLVILVFAVLSMVVLAGGFLFLSFERQAHESDALREAARVAERSNAAKSEFLSNMSHDIRTPMNAIIGFTNLAIQNPSDVERVREYLGKIQASSNHLLSLINDVLEMSRIESGKIEIDEAPCSLPEVLHDLNTIIIGQVEAKQHELFMDAVHVVHEDVFCDKLRLNQVLLNLLSNAVKYTPNGGRISVRLTELPCDREGYARYEIAVKDNGMGMTPEFAAKVFEAFEREKTSTVSGIQGTGLGMAITKSIVDLMGGDIQVETEKGKGSEFKVTVEWRYLDKPLPDRRIPALQGIRALVVDDDYGTCDSTTALLGEMGMQAEWTLSGQEAVLRVKQAAGRGEDFGLYILDWKLPDLSGLEVARQIRTVVGPAPSILLMTAYDWPSVRDEALEAGVNGFCNKPLFHSEMHAALERVFARPEASPHGEQTASESEQAEAQLPNFVGSRLLLVDDIEVNREIATMILEMNGFEVEQACDGTEAVEKVAEAEPGHFDAVLMDIQMPTMNGYDATRAIRASNGPNAYVPIIAMTANAFDEDKRRAEEAGMDGHVAKPIDVDILMRVLAAILAQAS